MKIETFNESLLQCEDLEIGKDITEKHGQYVKLSDIECLFKLKHRFCFYHGKKLIKESYTTSPIQKSTWVIINRCEYIVDELTLLFDTNTTNVSLKTVFYE